MVFSSIFFIFSFLPVTLFCYYIFPEKYKNFVLLFMSLIFYAWGEPLYVFLMILSILYNYICGLEIEERQKRGMSCKRELAVAVAVNLGILGFFKYAAFLIAIINSIIPFKIPSPDLPLPIGISFYTFQILSYVVDVYKKRVRVQKNVVAFGLYVTMFPQLVAGPIVQYTDVARQLNGRKYSLVNLGDGALIFIRGLGKKVLLANNIGLVFTEVSGLNIHELSVITAWIGCIAYTFQIYFDFSGYSDMAVGLGKMLGFQFMKNFDYPYISESLTEFWRRWHISLGQWFREYVYIPLGGNRVGKLKHIRNIFIVWMLTGLWHGASWNFVFWGVYYGILLLMEKYIWGNWLRKIPKVFRIMYTMFFVMTGWVFFYSSKLNTALCYIGAMFGSGGKLIDAQAVYLLRSNGIFLLILAVFATPIAYFIFKKIWKNNFKARIKFQMLCHVFIFLLSIAYLITETYNPFLYFRF